MASLLPEQNQPKMKAVISDAHTLNSVISDAHTLKSVISDAHPNLVKNDSYISELDHHHCTRNDVTLFDKSTKKLGMKHSNEN